MRVNLLTEAFHLGTAGVLPEPARELDLAGHVARHAVTWDH